MLTDRVGKMERLKYSGVLRGRQLGEVGPKTGVVRWRARTAQVKEAGQVAMRRGKPTVLSLFAPCAAGVLVPLD